MKAIETANEKVPPVDAALVAEARGVHFRAKVEMGGLGADERPGAEDQKARLGLERECGDGARRVVGGHGDNRDGAKAELGPELPVAGSGGDDRRQQAGRDAYGGAERVAPVAGAGVDEPGGARERQFGTRHAGQMMAHRIGCHQEARRGGLPGRRGPGLVGELVDCVDRKDLAAGPGEERLGRQGAVGEAAGGAGMAVVEGLAGQGAGGVEEGVVEPPAVDPDRIDAAGDGAGAPDARHDIGEDAGDIPVGTVVPFDGVAVEAVHLLHGDPVAVEAGEHDATAARAQIADDAVGHGSPQTDIFGLLDGTMRAAGKGRAGSADSGRIGGETCRQHRGPVPTPSGCGNRSFACEIVEPVGTCGVPPRLLRYRGRTGGGDRRLDAATTTTILGSDHVRKLFGASLIAIAATSVPAWAQDKQEVTVWSWFIQSTMEKSIEAFEKAHPGHRRQVHLL